MAMPSSDGYVKMCNCAECCKELLGAAMKGRHIPREYEREPVYGRLSDRPYCKRCYHKYKFLHGKRICYYQENN